jgi:hypothetical protein
MSFIQASNGLIGGEAVFGRIEHPNELRKMVAECSAQVGLAGADPAPLLLGLLG